MGKRDAILDVGCGGGKTISKLASGASEGKVYGVDFSKDSVGVASKVNRRLIEAGREENTRRGEIADERQGLW